VLVIDPAIEKLELALSDRTGVYVGPGVDADSYLSGLASDIRANVCVPFPLSATVMAPGFPDAPVGVLVSGRCVAHRAGYWLVYQSEQDRFCCFWGESRSNLGAHGVFGQPLYCWSA
jgi:hypothetical protein